MKRPDLPTVTLTLHASKYKVNEPPENVHLRCSLCTLYLLTYQVRIAVHDLGLCCCLSDVFWVLLKSLVCRFCTGTPGLVLFWTARKTVKNTVQQTFSFPTKSQSYINSQVAYIIIYKQVTTSSDYRHSHLILTALLNQVCTHFLFKTKLRLNNIRCTLAHNTLSDMYKQLHHTHCSSLKVW